MNQKKKGAMIFGLILGIVGLGGPAFAAPMLGESLLPRTFGGTTTKVDWVVRSNTGLFGGTVGVGFEYLYQVENYELLGGDTITGFSIEIDEPGKSSIIAGGTAAFDLDTIHTIGGETEPAGGPIGGGTYSITASGVNWSNLGVTATNESIVLGYLSLLPKTFNDGSALDGSNPWSTQSPGGTKLPVPAPEPTTFLGGALGLAAVALYARRRKKVA